MKKFRLLRADEIDCRPATISKNGVSLLLYKDARCDMNILDETVGPENWQRRHSRDNANCTVSIWDADKKMWVEKEDTGTESNTEKEKGLASDSFKRACFNWGIGRELYTAPFIWIDAGSCKVESAGTDRNGKEKFTCRDRFQVTEIDYDDNHCINKLTIKNINRRQQVYSFGATTSEPPAEPEKPTDSGKTTVPLVDQNHINALFVELKRTGIGRKGLLRQYGVSDIHELTVDQFKNAMDILAKKPDKTVDPTTVPPEGADTGLPWNTPAR